ncbi:MAG: hypothetical protein JO040_00995, partial [Gemmatimonadetes bacterium]|nr:hypothetical protein [Gemmatimonadota bacterium]
MHGTRSWAVAGLAWILAVGGCARDAHDAFDADDDNAPEAPRARPAAVSRTRPVQPRPAPPMSAADSAAARARVAAEGDSLRADFERGRKLLWSEVWELRRDVNAKQIATAQSLGVRASGQAEIDRLVRE